MTLDELLHDALEDVLAADGFEDAIIGLAQQFNTSFLVYDREKCIDILTASGEMDREEAEEYFDYNVQGAYVGPNTPAFVTTVRRRKRTS